MSKAKKGPLKDLQAEQLLTPLLKDCVETLKVNSSDLGEITIGNCLQPGAGNITSRMAQFMAGIPETVPLHTINRQCSSGLQAVAHVFNGIMSGEYECGIGGGVESMTNFSFNGSLAADKLSEDVYESEKAQLCIMGMGTTSDNVAEKFKLKRRDLDEFSVESHMKAKKATENGVSKSEILPFKVKNEKGQEVLVDYDSGIIKNATIEKVSKLKPVFDENGSTTAGNSSQVTDGAAVVFLATED